MKILLAIDSTKGSHLALEEALARPWPTNTEFLLLTVLERSFARFPEVLRDAEQQAINMLKAAGQKFVRAARTCSYEVIIGTPRNAISEFAREWKADLIILSSHGTAPWLAFCSVASLKEFFAPRLVPLKLCDRPCRTRRLLPTA